MASAYALGEHVVIFTDPQHQQAVMGFEPDGDLIEAYTRFVASVGAEVLGSGLHRTLVGATPDFDPSPAMVRMRLGSDADVARLNAFFDQCSESDLEEADIDRDDLDPVIFCIEATPGGELIGYASALPEPHFAGEWDIGVLTHVDHRRQGLGERCVRHLSAHLLAAGEIPLYRHDVLNDPSAALASAVGFVSVSSVTAARFG